MRNLLRCRRGSVAFATVIALVPLIGVVALGAEAGSWYVTKQHAQNAADAAAYSGGLRLACSILRSSTCDARHTDDGLSRQAICRTERVLQRAATPPIPARRVLRPRQEPRRPCDRSISRRQPSRVRATVSQQQPAYLAAVLGLSTVNIGATAIAQVKSPDEPMCAWAWTDSHRTSRGSSNRNRANGCGLMHRTARQVQCTRLSLVRAGPSMQRWIDVGAGWLHCRPVACHAQRNHICSAGDQSAERTGCAMHRSTTADFGDAIH